MKNNWKVNLYNKKHAFVYQYGEELIQFLNPKPDEFILDLGCGSGQLTNEISKSGANVIGIDNSKKMINDAQTKYPDLKFLVKDAANFQLNKLYDAIFSNAVLHWVTDSENAIISMNNNLKNGGRVVVEFGGKGNVKTIIESIKKALLERGYVKNTNIKNWFFPSISEYTSLLEKNGFEVEY
ncbi:MAG: class I SAM-dependent methyltransferase, partial [Flavobacteriaceae bacterium]|nr:class I SAM-dependent methyltransferase [Flavobacteriaceae bacterium]